MSVRVFRLFLSSPGDVAVERRRIAAVVSRLNGECAGRARIDTIRWETEAYQAHSTFQAQIPLAVECDLVLAIFKWRLGTEMPPEFPDRMADGTPYPSGTAYELLTSMEARRQGAENPDVFVYRYAGSAPRPEIDDPARGRIEQDWHRLQGFFERWFLTPEGHFKAAFQTYQSEDDCEAQIEALLRRWLTEKVAAGRILAWPDAIKGSPFPGLESYGRRHAAVFFGRDRDIGRGVEIWREAAQAGTPFLLVVGASGAGKSSLAKAGLVNRVTIPGVIETVDRWRATALRPGDSAEGPLAALAAALVMGIRDLPASEEGRGPAVPELLSAELPDASALARVFKSDPSAATAALLAALDAIGAAEQASDHRGRAVRVDLVLVVDQLEELFAPALPAEARDAFVAALAALAGSGRVWIVATLRADLYAAMLEHPGLKALKEAGRTLDLAPPGPAELAEIVRRPAEAADLRFGRDAETDESVDERLLREADRPDMLPLVQLALARLYEGRRQEGEATILPYDVYAGLGGLTGIIDEVGERGIAELDAAANRTLPQLTRSLAQLEQEGGLAGTLTVTARPLAEAAPDEPRRALVAALVAARLLTLADNGEGGLIRLAHQRVLTDWRRMRDIVQGSADFFRIRGEIDRRRLRWQENRRADLLLPRGLPLAEAEDVVARYGDEIAPETRAFVRASRARAGRLQMILGAAAATFALVAVGALFQWSVAREQTQLAERNFGVAREAVRGVVFDIVQGLRDVSGMRIDALRRILSTVQGASDKLVGTAPGEPALLRTRAGMFENFARIYASVGDVPAATTSADRAIDLLRALVRSRPDDVRVESDLSIPVVTRGTIAIQIGDMTGAQRYFEEAIGLARIGLRRAPNDPDQFVRLAAPLNRFGDARFALGDYTGALTAYREQADAIRKAVAASPENRDYREALWIAIFNVGFIGLERADFALASSAYEEAFSIAKALADEAPDSAGSQRSVAVMLSNLGELDLRAGRKPDAMARFDEAVAIERRIMRDDPENAERQRTLAIAIEKQGNGAYATGNWGVALKSYQESLAILRNLVARNSLDLRNQRSIVVALGNVAEAKRELRDLSGAREMLDERLALARRLVEQQGGNFEARTDLAISLRDLAEAKERAGEPTLDLRREAVAIARPLARIDPSYWTPLKLFEAALRSLADAQRASGDLEGALETIEEQTSTLRHLLVLRPKESELRPALARGLFFLGILRALGKDASGSSAAFEESAALYRALAEEGNPEAADLLDTVFDYGGRMGFMLGDRDRTRDSYRSLLAYRRERAAKDDTPARRHAVAEALIKLAPYEANPISLLEEAIAIIDALPEDARQEAKAARQEAEEALEKAKTLGAR